MRVRAAQLFNSVLPEVFLKSRSHSAAGSLASKKTMEGQSWIMPLRPVTWLDQFESELGASVNSAKEVQARSWKWCSVFFRRILSLPRFTYSCRVNCEKKVVTWLFRIPMLRATNDLVSALLLGLNNSHVNKLEEELRRAKAG